MNQAPGKKPPGPLLFVAVALFAGLAGLALGGVTAPLCTCPACPSLEDGPVDADASIAPGEMAVRPVAAKPCEPREWERMRRRIEELQTRTAFMERLQEGYRATKEGVPEPWPEDIPPQYRAERYQAIVAAALDELQAPAELVGFDCSEPPCIAKLRVLSGSSAGFAGSKTWKKNFGRGRIGSQLAVECGDGRTERIQLLAPMWDGKNDPSKMTAEEYIAHRRKSFLKHFDGTRSEEEKSRERRLTFRLRHLKEAWTCAPAH